jgi:ATP-binding cassette subfamily G (WHITE) protein 2 (SNQ2)
MYYVQDSRTFNHQAGEIDGNRMPLHNVNENSERGHNQNETDEESEKIEGTWGENDVGCPINSSEAKKEFEELQRELSSVSRIRSRGGVTRKSTRHSNVQTDLECQLACSDAEDETEEENFQLSDFLKAGHFEKRKNEASGKRMSVCFKHLTVQGVGETATFVKTLPEAVLGTFGPDLYRLCARFIPGLPTSNSRGARRCLINDFNGVVRNGEMLLVLGRPGSGCSTFLKSVTNKRSSYAAVTGDVHYGGIDAQEQLKNYRGEVVYNEEDDRHFPDLTVEQTLKFSLLNKTKKNEKDSIPIVISALLKMFRISHTRHTLVGDAFVRGVSGGERKRVSIAETLATKSTVVAWDNSTRGLDASTALDYAKSLRIMTDVSDRTTLVTLYQAGEGIYELMDKVMVIDEGRMVYSGPAVEAKAYFQDLGYYCPDRMTTADFLTECTDPNARKFRQDFNRPVPKGPVELEAAFHGSSHFQEILRDIESYEQALKDSEYAHAREFKNTVQESKSRTISKQSPYTVSFVRQVFACTQREIWLTLGDRTNLYTKTFIIISVGLIAGSVFHGQSLDTDGAFSRGGKDPPIVL